MFVAPAGETTTRRVASADVTRTKLLTVAITVSSPWKLAIDEVHSPIFFSSTHPSRRNGVSLVRYPDYCLMTCFCHHALPRLAHAGGLLLLPHEANSAGLRVLQLDRENTLRRSSRGSRSQGTGEYPSPIAAVVSRYVQRYVASQRLGL